MPPPPRRRRGSTLGTKLLLTTVLVQLATIGAAAPILLPPVARRLEPLERELPGLTRGILRLGTLVREHWVIYAVLGGVFVVLLLLCEWKVPWRDAVAKQYCFLIFCLSTVLCLMVVGLALPFWLGLV